MILFSAIPFSEIIRFEPNARRLAREMNAYALAQPVATQRDFFAGKGVDDKADDGE
jgi:hypothetical protein